MQLQIKTKQSGGGVGRKLHTGLNSQLKILHYQIKHKQKRTPLNSFVSIFFSFFIKPTFNNPIFGPHRYPIFGLFSIHSLPSRPFLTLSVFSSNLPTTTHTLLHLFLLFTFYVYHAHLFLFVSVKYLIR